MKLFFSILVFILLTGIGAADAPGAEQPKDEPSSSILTGPIRLFQNTISSADGNRCPMTPSCSSYAMEATKQHGALMGWIMACDRLLRCGRDEVKQCTPKKTRNGFRCSDPVGNNDFWWNPN